MKNTNPLKLCLLAGLLAAGIAGCSQKPSKPSLEGRWTGFDAGQPNRKCTLTINGAQLEYHGADSNDWCRATFVCNETAQPAQIDITMLEPAASPYTGKIALGVYELQGDALKVAAAEPGAAVRPASVAGGPQIRSFVFKRE